MLNWLNENKDWFFSGGGVVFLGWLGTHFFNKYKKEKNGNQSISAGDDSTNSQVGRDLNSTQNYYGISYRDAKEISLEVFEANSYLLSEEASKIANKRAEELTDKLLFKIKELEKSMPALTKKFQDPDIQYTVVNAQKQYARSGNKEILDLLSELLIKRFQSNNDSLKSIVLNESIEVLSKLTANQISMITTLFIVKNCRIINANELINLLYEVMPNQMLEVGGNISFFEHLMYAGVITHDVTELNHQNLEYLITKLYSKDLNKHIEGSTLNAIEPSVRKQFVIDSKSEEVFNNWNNSALQNYSLTSTGKAIALANYNLIFNTNVDLEIWIKD